MDVESMPPLVRDNYDMCVAHYGTRARVLWDGNMLSLDIRDGGGECDFCSSRQGPYSIWPADDITIYTEARDNEVLTHRSQGPWVACLGCTPFVAAGNREGLLQHAIAAGRDRHGNNWNPLIIIGTRAAHRAYWKARRA